MHIFVFQKIDSNVVLLEEVKLDGTHYCILACMPGKYPNGDDFRFFVDFYPECEYSKNVPCREKFIFCRRALSYRPTN